MEESLPRNFSGVRADLTRSSDEDDGNGFQLQSRREGTLVDAHSSQLVAHRPNRF